jgi:hypothetical protein
VDRTDPSERVSFPEWQFPILRRNFMKACIQSIDAFPKIRLPVWMSVAFKALWLIQIH